MPSPGALRTISALSQTISCCWIWNQLSFLPNWKDSQIWVYNLIPGIHSLVLMLIFNCLLPYRSLESTFVHRQIQICLSLRDFLFFLPSYISAVSQASWGHHLWLGDSKSLSILCLVCSRDKKIWHSRIQKPEELLLKLLPITTQPWFFFSPYLSSPPSPPFLISLFIFSVFSFLSYFR